MVIGLQGIYNYRGLQIENAFARIDTVQSYGTHCTLCINIYVSQDAWNNGESYLEQVYPVEFEKQIGDAVGDDRTQGYSFAKSIEQFLNWEIVTE